MDSDNYRRGFRPRHAPVERERLMTNLELAEQYISEGNSRYPSSQNIIRAFARWLDEKRADEPTASQAIREGSECSVHGHAKDEKCAACRECEIYWEGWQVGCDAGSYGD